MKNIEAIRKLLTFGADALCVVVGGLICAYLYYSAEQFVLYLDEILSFVSIIIVTMGLLSLVFKTYNDSIHENISSSAIASIGTFVLAFLLSVFFMFLIDTNRFESIFYANLAAYSIVMLGMFRILIHMIRRINSYFISQQKTSTMQRVIIIGAGDAGKYLVEMLRNDKTKNQYPVAFIDDNPDLVGRTIKGLKVVGSRELIPYASDRYNADVIIIAIPFVDNSTIRDIFRLCCEADCNVYRFGNMTTFTQAGLSKATINSVRVEDLLGRDVVKLDLRTVSAYIAGQTVFVSGGAGSIGFELCNQILNYNAKLVVIFDISENSLFHAETELSKKYPKTQYVTCIGSIQDRARLRELFEQYKPSIVFHAAAHKHVPMMEINPQEALKNNVMGTVNMVEVAIKEKVKRFVLISTDKAVNPTNIMGATKRVSEMLIQRANAWGSTQFSAVRFGNVLGSNGSVIPLFTKQIQEGGPLTVTHKKIKRYFMTIPEAVQLVLEAGSLSIGGEIFVLDMGEPVNIYELAKSMIRLSGLQPGKDIAIEITGLRPGEKLFEEISLSDEVVSKTQNERIFVLNANNKPAFIFEEEFDKLCQSIDKRDFHTAFNEVGLLVPTYHRKDYHSRLR